MLSIENPHFAPRFPPFLLALVHTGVFRIKRRDRWPHVRTRSDDQNGSLMSSIIV